MRVIYSFLFIFVAASLFLLPFTQGIYDFRTDVREDTFTTETAAGVTTGNASLIKSVYDDDTETIDITSSLSTDVPAYSSYNTTSRQLVFSGLTANTSRTIYISYDVNALVGSPAIGTFLNISPFLWYAFIIVLIGAAIVALLTGRA